MAKAKNPEPYFAAMKGTVRKGYTTYGKKHGQSHKLHKTRAAAENDLKKYAASLKKGKSDRKVVVVACNDLMFYDEAYSKPVWHPPTPVGKNLAVIEFREAVKDEGGKYQSVREALDEKRKQLKGKVTALILCKKELFYKPDPNTGKGDTVYPVLLETAQREAEFFGCEVHEV